MSDVQLLRATDAWQSLSVTFTTLFDFVFSHLIKCKSSKWPSDLKVAKPASLRRDLLLPSSAGCTWCMVGCALTFQDSELFLKTLWIWEVSILQYLPENDESYSSARSAMQLCTVQTPRSLITNGGSIQLLFIEDNSEYLWLSILAVSSQARFYKSFFVADLRVTAVTPINNPNPQRHCLTLRRSLQVTGHP